MSLVLVSYNEVLIFMTVSPTVYLGKLRILYFQCLTLNITFERTPDFTRTHTAWTQCRIVWKFHHFIIKEHPCLQFPQMIISIWGALDVWKRKTIRLSKVLIIWQGHNSLKKSPTLFDYTKLFQKKREIFSNFMAFSQYMNLEGHWNSKSIFNLVV
jgi:hypothetical protein